MKMFVEVHIAGRNPERHELIGECTMLGTRADAGIRFHESSGLGAELVELLPGPRGVRVDIPMGVKGALVFDGQQHRQVSVPFGGEVFVGSARLTFLSVEVRRPSPVVALAATVALLAVGLQVYRESAPVDPTIHEVVAPELFDSQSAGNCPERERARAQNHEWAAFAKEQRLPFVIGDGVDAALLLRRARACYQAAGRSGDASRMTGEITRLTARLNEQYATLRLRLRVALEKKRYGDALDTARDLQGLLARQPDSPYRRWLSQLQRTLERKASRAERASP